jgi:mannose-6-phosphate isomerase-like protein (cupin superfamily)
MPSLSCNGGRSTWPSPCLSHRTRQSPHAQDEVYVIVRGRGVLLHDGKRDSFEAGDLLFVAAGTEHQFEDFGADLAVWRVFYGPSGGEVAAK